MAKRITIKDIAQQAGVSVGTVDRVLHNRGNVSKRSRSAIEKVLMQSGYVSEAYFAPSAKPCALAVLTPSSTIGDYWSDIYEGIKRALTSLNYPGLSLEFFHYNQFDVYSCLAAQGLVLKRKPDGVIIGPTFLEEAQRFCASLEDYGIPYVFVDSHFDGTNPVAYFSIDQIAGGKTLAHLISACTREGSKLAVFESRRSDERMSSNSFVRRDGFMEYLDEVGRTADMVKTCYTSTTPYENEQTVKSLLEEYSDLGGIAVLNSRGSDIADVLEKIGRQDIKLISFDLTMRNTEHLRRGSILALLCQHPQRQGYMAATTLVQYLMLGKTPETVQNYCPIDIILKETIDHYKE